MKISDYLAESGLSPGELAARLNEHGIETTRGNPFRAKGIAGMVKMDKDLPERWQRVLGIEVSEPPPSPEGSEAGPGSPGEGTDGHERREAPPRRPAEARITIVEPGARKRIAGAYKFAGAALAAGAGSNGVAEVWADQADPIAELWIAAAQDNPWAARFVNMMSAGGAGGDLAAAHLYLVGATFYVLGAGIPGGDAIFAKYSRHRPPEPVRPPAETNGHEREPAADAAPAPGPVGDGLA